MSTYPPNQQPAKARPAPRYCEGSPGRGMFRLTPDGLNTECRGDGLRLGLVADMSTPAVTSSKKWPVLLSQVVRTCVFLVSWEVTVTVIDSTSSFIPLSKTSLSHGLSLTTNHT